MTWDSSDSSLAATRQEVLHTRSRRALLHVSVGKLPRVRAAGHSRCMPRRVTLPTVLGSAFTVHEARRAGVGYGRTRGVDLVAPFHGVRAIRGSLDADSPEARIRLLARAYAPRLRAGQFFCDVTALAILGMPLPASEPVDRVHVGVSSPRRSPRTRGVVGHALADPTVLAVSGMPTLSPVEAWAQSSARLSVRDLVVLGDALVRRKAPLATLAELAQYVESRRGCRGFRRLERATTLVRAGTDSPRETVLRLTIIEAGLPEPAVNVPIRDARGRFLGLGDLEFLGWNVVVEYDGGYHFASDRQIHHDIERLATFADAGKTVIRVDKFYLKSPALILGRIRAALIAAGWVEPSRSARSRRRSSVL